MSFLNLQLSLLTEVFVSEIGIVLQLYSTLNVQSGLERVESAGVHHFILDLRVFWNPETPKQEEHYIQHEY